MSGLTVNVVLVSEMRLRHLIQEELARHDQRGLDNLMEAVAEPRDETDEMAAVLATLSEDEWNALVQRVKDRKR